MRTISCRSTSQRARSSSLSSSSSRPTTAFPPSSITRRQRAAIPSRSSKSGAILQYLAEKTGRFLPADLKGRTEALQWLYWQMGGLGPMLGQNLHFAAYAPEKIPHAIERYVRETDRLFGVLNGRLADRTFVAGDYSIADMASYPWVIRLEREQPRFGVLLSVENCPPSLIGLAKSSSPPVSPTCYRIWLRISSRGGRASLRDRLR